MAFRFHNFSISFGGDGAIVPPSIVAYSMGRDRYSERRGITSKVLIQLSGPSLSILPGVWDGFLIERSMDTIIWTPLTGVLRDTFYFIDTPPSDGVYHYRAIARDVVGNLSAPGAFITITVGKWGDLDILNSHEIDISTGNSTDKLPELPAFPSGLGGLKHEGVSLSEGSFAAGFSSGIWYAPTKELQAPITHTHDPLCGGTNIPLPRTQLSYSIRDLPYPVGGSGIDDTSLQISLSVSSQAAGSFLLIRNGLTQPQAPTITAVVNNGVDLGSDRDVLITVPGGYLGPGDTVVIRTTVSDNDGNVLLNSDCTFTMGALDITGPTISQQDPVCGTGLLGEPFVPRDFDYEFNVSDTETGVDLSTLNVFYGPTPTGPWTQVLQNGTTYLNGFSGSIISDGLSGYNVIIKRPVTDPLWDDDVDISFRVDIDDNAGNSTQDICSLHTAPCVTLRRVFALAENMLYVEFSSEVKNDDFLRDPNNYKFTPVLSATREIFAKKIKAQGSVAAADPEAPDTRLGVDNPRFVIVDTTIMDAWAQYDFVTENLLDSFGIPFCDPLTPVRFRAKRTKIDEGRDSGKNNELLQRDSMARRILTALLSSDEEIGGVGVIDDWDIE